MYRYNTSSDLAWNDLIRQWMAQVSTMTDQGPKVLVRRKFLEISSQIACHHIKMDALDNSLIIFSDKAVMFEFQYKSISELNLSVDELASKIFPIMEAMKILRNDMTIVKHEIEAGTIEFEYLNRSYDDIMSFVKNDIEKFNRKCFLRKRQDRNKSDRTND